ncbi:SHOCT domain-containing protein [Planctomycetes bacterium K23_9]|uniref:SHOCT domain-containing protein n=1 Tax=Stieleria marina TaxID=1930275 RepID=A0A517P086_9BACT|nr:hypothetical protein K239x_47970 [Planctomycetes bacterium K23_9]
MSNLSPAGQQLVQQLAQQYGVSTDAVTHMLIAVYNGNGTMAQFNHPEFGGAGQWMRGGMTMVSDLFNNQLKCLVNNVCSDLSNQLANNQSGTFTGSFQSQSQSGSHDQTQTAGGSAGQNSLFLPDPNNNWWPPEFGSPSATGSQNNVRYAYFADRRRLAVKTGTSVWCYDTGDHQIGGFSQQQGVGGSITFTSQFGVVNLSTLPVVSRDGIEQPYPPAPAVAPVDSFTQDEMQAPTPNQGSMDSSNVLPNPAMPAEPVAGENVLDTLERLGQLREKGILTDEEFGFKKAELLKRL